MESLTNIEIGATKFVNDLGINLAEVRQNESSEIGIPPHECGPISPIFTSINLTVTLTPFDYTNINGRKGARLELKYDYQHPAGGNGYTAEYYTYDDGKSFLTYAEAKRELNL